MTTEEKAKAYDEALERAKEIHSFSSDIAEIKRMEQIFPELAESEDERIRKEIISALKYANHEGVYNKHLAWLEKQSRNIIANSIIAEQEAVLQELKVLHLRMEKQTVCNDAGGNKMWRKAWRFVNEAINIIEEDKESYKW